MREQSRPNVRPETLEEAYKRVERRSWKHRAMAAAFLGCTALAGMQGIKEISGMGAPTPSQPNGGGQKGLGLLWLALAAGGALAGTAYVGPKIAKDQDRLDHLGGLLESGVTHIIEPEGLKTAKKSSYMKGETFEEAENRNRIAAAIELSGAALLTVTGAYMVNKGLGETSTVKEVFSLAAGLAQWAGVPVLVIDGRRHLRMLHDAKRDVAIHGPDARPGDRRRQRAAFQESEAAKHEPV